MKTFKFFNKKTEEQMVPIMCVDSEQTFHIPVIMYGNIMRAGVRHFENGMDTVLVRTFVSPSEGYRYQRDSYTYRIDNTYRLVSRFGTILIEYSIKFFEVEGYLRFRTTARLDLTNE